MSGTSSFKYGFKLKKNKNVKENAPSMKERFINIRSLTKTQMTNRKGANHGDENYHEKIKSTPNKLTNRKYGSHKMRTSEIVVKDHLL